MSTELGDAVGGWWIHIVGPDDLIPAPDELTALRQANAFNVASEKQRREFANDPKTIRTQSLSCDSRNKMPDLVQISKDDVVEAAKQFVANYYVSIIERHRAHKELFEAVTLLEERERQKAQLYDPDHFNPAKGGNKASDDYW